MRATFLVVFFVFVAFCATADEIDDVVTNLPDGWDDDQQGTIILPKTASTNDVFQSVLGRDAVPYCSTNFTVLRTRQIAIPSSHISTPVYSYTAVLVQGNGTGTIQIQGIRRIKVVVLMRYIDVYDQRAWLSSVHLWNGP